MYWIECGVFFFLTNYVSHEGRKQKQYIYTHVGMEKGEHPVWIMNVCLDGTCELDRILMYGIYMYVYI